MKKWLLRILYAFIALMPVAVWADYNATVGSGTVIFAFTCFTSKVCPAHVITNSAGTEINTTSNPAQVGAPASAFTDGWDATQGTKADSAWVSGSGSVIALLKNIANGIAGSIPAGSALIGKVGIDQTTPGTTNAVSATNFPSSVSTGTGAQGASSPRVTVATDQATNAGAALVKGGVGTVNGGSFYQAVAASQTATVLQSSTGAAGDYLSHCVIYPTSTSPGSVTVFDNTNTAANSAILFAGGASSTSNLTPIAVPVGAVSVNGAWKVTTGSAVSVVCYGKFS